MTKTLSKDFVLLGSLSITMPTLNEGLLLDLEAHKC